jgi:succinate dehydrogenase flavin-adding protein (antitoxin of CptAB toxin-antitoxin module)
MPRIDIYFDEMIKKLTLANLNYMEAILENQDNELS